MATGTILLPVLAAVPDASNPPGLAFSSTLGLPYLAFDAATDEICTFHFRMPVNYDNTAAMTLNVQWFGTSGTTSGDVIWGCQILAVTGNTDGGAIDSETFGTANTVTDSHLGTTGDRLHDVALTISTANDDGLAADDYVILKFYRDADNASDTYNGANANVVALSLEYTTT